MSDKNICRTAEYEKIFLITAYTKEEKDNLSDSERAEIRHLINVLEEQLREK